MPNAAFSPSLLTERAVQRLLRYLFGLPAASLMRISVGRSTHLKWTPNASTSNSGQQRLIGFAANVA